MAAVEMLGQNIPPELLSRDLEWFKVWSQSGFTPEPPWLSLAEEAIKKFESCRLTAYLCPAGIWTIGWGATRIEGRPVREGDTISQAQADAMLRNEVEQVGARLLEALPPASAWSPNRIAALISWTFNVGTEAMKQSTLRMRLVSGQDPVTVVKEELPRWNKVNGRPSEGLVARRISEINMFTGLNEAPKQPAKISPFSPFATRLTPNITLGEFALNQEERRFAHQYQVDTAAEIASFLERVRSQFGGNPVIITSGYRPPSINRSVGGASASEHLYSAPGVGAVDFYVKNVDTKKVQDWCDSNWKYSLGYGAPKGFVHLGIRAGRPEIRWDY